MNKVKWIGPLLLILSFILISSGRKEGKVFSEIKNYIDECEVKDGVEIAVEDFTSFDWDTVLVFYDWCGTQAISDALGIPYTKTVDMESGLIFMKDDTIVYEERIFTDQEKDPPLKIFPYTNARHWPRVNTFTKGKAVFRAEQIIIGPNVYRYVLYPAGE